MVFVKICGLRDARHVDAALDAGADAIGFVLTESPRFVTALSARELVSRIGDRALTVGVFRNEPVAEIERLATQAGVGAVQVHGDYGRDDFARLGALGFSLIRAIPFTALGAGPDAHGLDTIGSGIHGFSTNGISTNDRSADRLLVDAPRAGSGESWDYAAMAGRGLTGQWLLAGGLTPGNVAAAITAASPWGVDVSSGVESSPGHKDAGLIHEFLAAAKPDRSPR